MPCYESWIYCYDLETKHAGSPRRPDKANSPTNFWWSLFLTALAWSTSTGFPLDKTVNKEYYAKVLWKFRKRFRRKRPALFKSGQWHFHQDNAPFHNSILVTDYFTKMGIKTVPHPPYSPDLAPCDFWLFPKLRGDERGCDEGHWHAHSRGLP